MARWQYAHEYTEACKVEEQTGYGIQTKVGAYPQASIQKYLDKMGADGWELVMMEPEWFWERVGISMAMELTRPRAIIGYWCTFKRAET